MPLQDFESPLSLGTPSAAAVGADFLSSPSGSAPEVRDDGAFRGTQYLRMKTGTSGGNGYYERAASLGAASTGTLHVRFRFRVPVLPPDATGVRLFVFTDSSGAFRGEVHLNNVGQLRFRNPASSTLYTYSGTYAAGTWVDLGVAILAFSSTVGQYHTAVFNGAGSTDYAEEYTSSANVNTLGSGGQNKIQLGSIRSSGLNSYASDWDDIDHSTSGSYPSIPVPAVGPSVRYGPLVAGAVTPTGFGVSYWLDDTTSARLVVSTSSDLSSPVYGSSEAPDADGIVKLTVTGLTPDTQYYYGVELDGDLSSDGRGEAKTFPAPGTPKSFSFWFGSCQWDVPTTSSYDAILAYSGPYGRATFGVHLGDLHYRDPTTGWSIADALDQHRISLTAAVVAPCLAKIPMNYWLDNHDYGLVDDRTNPVRSVVTGSIRRIFPHYPLPATNGEGGYHSWTHGRIRFIQLDTRTYRDPATDLDGPSKTMLGTEQKAWFKSELLKPEPVKIICSSGYWRLDAPSSERWGAYETEFDELNDFIDNNRGPIGNVYAIFGDRHALCADNGTSSGARGIPQAGGAPLQQTTVALPGGEVWSAGYYAPAGTLNAFGWMDVTDDGGNTITLAYKGISSNDGVTRVSMTTVFNVAPAGATPGIPAVV